MSKKSISRAILTIGLLWLAACTQSNPPEIVTSETPNANIPVPTQVHAASVANRIDLTGPGLYVNESGQVIVDLVGSATPGWLCIHADEGQKPGPMLGCSAVPAGESHDVSVFLDLTKLTWKLHTVLYEDAGTPGEIEIPSPDVLATSTSGVPISFQERLIGDLTWITVEDQPLGEGKTALIPRVYTPIPALLVVHNGMDAGVGWAPLQAGENLDLVVPINIVAEIKTPHAMLHWDGNASGQYENFNIDPPVVTSIGDILTVEFRWTDR